MAIAIAIAAYWAISGQPPGWPLIAAFILGEVCEAIRCALIKGRQ